jgi:hypothetical protein
MAKIIAIHGTYAHMETGAPGGAAPPIQWWQPGSVFESDMRRLLDADDGKLDLVPFKWSGDNSERGRRKAGRDLLAEIMKLEQAGEPYVLIGHSHGGSVIAKALLEAARKNVPLTNMRRWMTVGTPFVELRKEALLFQRLNSFMKAMFVASLMLALMFAMTLGADLLDGRINFGNDRQLLRLAITGGLTTLPFAIFLIVAYALERRKLFHYRKRTRRRAREAFEGRWLPLTHEDDEAVRGLGSLKGARFQIFSSEFAVPVLSALAVFLLPIAYLWLLFSPGAMVGITEMLKSQVYDVAKYQSLETSYEERLGQLRSIRRQIRQSRRTLDEKDFNANERLDAEARLRSLRSQRRDLRRDIETSFPEFRGIARAVRFKRRFLERGGKPCEGNTLCGKGTDIALNSKLLFHLVTDEASALVLNPDDRPTGTFGRLVAAFIPVLLVPLVFGALAIVLVIAIQALAGLLSRFAGSVLDRLTWFEVNRAALGNDTDAEVAVLAAAKPYWIERPPAFLPPQVADLISAKSNEAAIVSITKFRSALSDFAMMDGAADRQRSVLALLSWQELIHMVYFEVPEFRRLIATAIASEPGFVSKPRGEGVTPEARAWLAQQSGRSSA